MTVQVRVLIAALAFAAPVHWNVGPAAAASPERNVVLISLDTLRADRLSCYGNALATTPRIDALAAGGARVERAVVPSSSTAPSHMTMLTGTHPCRHNIWNRGSGNRLPSGIETLAEILKRAGFTTAAFTEDAGITADLGFARGFDTFEEFVDLPQKTLPKGAVHTPTNLGPHTFEKARQWLSSHGASRFFLFVHTYQVHGPRRPKPPYDGLFGGPDSTGKDPAFRSLRRYDQLIRQSDDLVAGLLETLDDVGAAKDTLVILTSDHGEAFGEYGDWGHGEPVHEAATRVPLILWAPGLIGPGVIDGLVSIADIVPTTLDLLGLPMPEGLDGRNIGKAARARGRRSIEVPSRALYFESATGKTSAVRDDRFIVSQRTADATEALVVHDSSAAPSKSWEFSRFVADRPEEGVHVKELHVELERRREACETSRREAEKWPRRAHPRAPDIERKLRALGYTD